MIISSNIVSNIGSLDSGRGVLPGQSANYESGAALRYLDQKSLSLTYTFEPLVDCICSQIVRSDAHTSLVMV